MDIKYFYTAAITILIYQFSNLLISLSSDETTFWIWNIGLFYPIICFFEWIRKKIKRK